MLTNPALWRRLQSVAFDDLDAAFPFPARLARDNGWTRDFTERVIEEYRRFVFLAFAAGHEVTPSDEVDQAWHLHLTYTRNYWGDFTEALGGPLHHGPTRGGASEHARYAENYDATREAYMREFGEAPPTDIWPAPEIRFGDAPYMRRVNTRESMVLPRRGLRRATFGVAIAAGGASMVGAVAAADTGGVSIGDISQWISDNRLLTVGLLVAAFALLLSVLSRFIPKGKSQGGTGGCGGGVVSGGGKDGSGCGADGGGGGCGGCGG